MCRVFTQLTGVTWLPLCPPLATFMNKHTTLQGNDNVSFPVIKRRQGINRYSFQLCWKRLFAAMETDVGLSQSSALIQYTAAGCGRVECSQERATTNGCRDNRRPAAGLSCFTCAQYWDLATATSSLRMGWDCDTRGETAWMTAVNLENGLIPGK